MKQYIKSYFRIINESIDNYGNHFGLGVSLICLLLGLFYPETITRNGYYVLFAGLAILFAWSIRSDNRGDLFTVIVAYILGELMIYSVAFDTSINNVGYIYETLPDSISLLSNLAFHSLIIARILAYLGTFENSEEDSE
jgi:hypothetical protein